ncbi:MAG: hypothetical protein AAF533_26415 [Acidobacteriota bacterium]
MRAHGENGERRPTGTSLVETLVATALLGIVLVALLGGVTRARHVLESARQLDEAEAVAAEVLATARRLHVLQLAELLAEDDPTGARATWRSNHPPSDHLPPEWSELLTSWREAVDGLPGGRLIVSVRGFDRLGPDVDDVPLLHARFVQLAVTVRWREGVRERATWHQHLFG